MITMGGNAELELVDSLDPFSEGIVFSVMPPKKSWKNIANLSGGEKVTRTKHPLKQMKDLYDFLDFELLGTCICTSPFQTYTFICDGWDWCCTGFPQCIDCCQLYRRANQECTICDYQSTKQHVWACWPACWYLQDEWLYQEYCHQSIHVCYLVSSYWCIIIYTY